MLDTITGVVEDDNFNPAPNVTVALILREGGNVVEYTTTDANGIYEFEFHPDSSADGSLQEYHVAVYDDVAPIFNTFSEPFVEAALSVDVGQFNPSATYTSTIPTAVGGVFDIASTFTGPSANAIDATGGTTVTTFTDASNIEYKIHAFENVGADTFTVTVAPPDAEIDVLLVGGGGAGGNNNNSGQGGGGGGAGEVTQQNNVSVTPQSFTITVGEGGVNAEDDGDDTIAFGTTAIGGDGGTNKTQYGNLVGGGQGGDSGNGFPGGGQGFADDGGGGGGGATSGGGNGSDFSGGNGGAGLDVSTDFGTTFGENGMFGGGGGGGETSSGFSDPNGGDGGVGGGGDGEDTSRPVTDGDDNTGGGGGGGRGEFGTGGSGIVLIRYPVEDD